MPSHTVTTIRIDDLHSLHDMIVYTIVSISINSYPLYSTVIFQINLFKKQTKPTISSYSVWMYNLRSDDQA